MKARVGMLVDIVNEGAEDSLVGDGDIYGATNVVLHNGA